jgi:hypothetical protein
MKDAVADAVQHSSNMTTQKPTGADFKTYSLDATVTSLTCTGNNLEAKVSMALSEDDHMFGFLNGSGKVQSPNPKKRDDDVEALIEGVIDSLVKNQVSKAIQPKLPKT